MRNIVECVMNVSEGRSEDKLAAICARIEDEGGLLLGCSSDYDHHRSVISFIGTTDAAAAAAFSAVEKALELIDLRIHRGVHPRIGAVDVIPFVPIRGVTMHQCELLARRLGERMAQQLGVPVYLYGEAAIDSRRRELSVLRRGQFEGLSREIRTNPDRKPDFGPAALHSSAGATAVGARGPLIAYNVYLETGDVAVAKEIASKVRASSGGLPGIKALGFYIARRRQAQVSMNVIDFHKTSLLTLFSTISRESERLGTEATSSEVVGLVPREALANFEPDDLKLEDFHGSQILENRIAEVLEGKNSGRNGEK